MKPQHVLIEPDTDRLALKTAQKVVQTAGDCVEQTSLFTLAISGGTTPRAMHRLLAKTPWRERMPWQYTHIFQVDERCVPVADSDSNYGNAQKDLLDQIPIPSAQIHRMPGELNPVEAARRYQEEIQAVVNTSEDGFPVFDLIILGVGTDGHTASLFPDHAALEETRHWVLAVKGGDPCVNRLTLTLPVLNHARRIFFMAEGVNKAGIVKMIFSETKPVLPAGRIRPVNGRVTWLLDQAAAAHIE